MNIPQLRNELMLVRRRRGLSRKQVAAILGYKATTTITKIELGKLIPPLAILLKLEILYRTPLGYLYPHLYATLRDAVRSAEATILKTPEGADQEATYA